MKMKHCFPFAGEAARPTRCPRWARSLRRSTTSPSRRWRKFIPLIGWQMPHTFVCNTLQSGLLINDGQGQFTFRPLPRIAQIAPGFGVALADVNADGNVDLCLAQNFFTPQLETGRMSGGVSLLLLGDGTGDFEPVWPNRSGIVVGGDAKSLSVVDLNGDNRARLCFRHQRRPNYRV